MKTHSVASRFVLRAPILPFAAAASCIDVASLRRLLDDPVILEAVFVASPELFEHLAAWRAGSEPRPDPAIERALVRYLSRMSGRATPFGLFSGVVVGEVGASTRLELAARDRHRRHTRLDNDYLFKLCDELARDRAVRGELRYAPNTSLYFTAGRWRYAVGRFERDTRSYDLVAVDASDYLGVALARARDGATIGELADALAAALADDPELTRDDIETFVHDLIDAQLLVPELQPPVTGDEPAGVLARLLARTPATRRIAHVLDDATRQLAAIDDAPPGTPADRYRAVARTLEELPPKVNLPRLFQVDLHLARTQLTLGTHVIAEIERGVELLRRFGREAADDDFSRFREAFQRRYETREVPLVDVLDEESGIGFGSNGSPATTAPLLAELAFRGRAEPPKVSWSPRARHLLQLCGDALAAGAGEIELTDADVDALASKTPAPLADTAAVMVELVAASAQAADDGKFQLLMSSVTGAATRLLGRFCHGSPEITDLVGELVAAERRLCSDVVFAEVVHLPEGRIGNILLRPTLREHEIVFLGVGGADREHQIPITDLDVSIAGDKVVLRSRRLGKEARPQLASAHNFSARSLVVYRFLCAHAMQYGEGAGWSWGALDDAPYLPRVRHGRIVLSRARWRLRRSDLERLDKATRGAKAAKTAAAHDELRAKSHAAVQALRDARRLPRWIVVGDGDNELPVDLDNPLATASFAHLVKQRQSATLWELFPGPDQLCVHGPGGGFTHELLVPLVRGEAPARRPPAPVPPRTELVRRFAPGTGWLYAKLYGGAYGLELVLREHVRPFVAEVLGEQLASQFFFIRYSDPDLHVRLRFAGDPAVLVRELLPRLAARCQLAIDAGLAWRLQLDTYEREVERYGGDAGIELAEQLFAADSAAVLDILDTCPGDDGAEAKWRLALRGIDRLLADLGLPIADRLAIMTRARDGFGAEHGMDTELQKRLGDKFRAHRDELAALLAAPDDDVEHPLAAGIAALAERSRRNAPIAAALRVAPLSMPVAELAGSYVHMHVNRVLAAAQRQQELVLYDLLRRHYDGVVARERATARQANAP